MSGLFQLGNNPFEHPKWWTVAGLAFKRIVTISSISEYCRGSWWSSGEDVWSRALLSHCNWLCEDHCLTNQDIDFEIFLGSTLYLNKKWWEKVGGQYGCQFPFMKKYIYAISLRWLAFLLYVFHCSICVLYVFVSSTMTVLGNKRLEVGFLQSVVNTF